MWTLEKRVRDRCRSKRRFKVGVSAVDEKRRLTEGEQDRLKVMATDQKTHIHIHLPMEEEKFIGEEEEEWSELKDEFCRTDLAALIRQTDTVCIPPPALGTREPRLERPKPLLSGVCGGQAVWRMFCHG